MPRCHGKLRKEDQEKIMKHYVFLLDELDGKTLINYMVQEEVFNMDDKEEIITLVPRPKRIEKFLEKLLDAGPGKAYKVFLQALKKCYPHVAQRLESKESHVRDTSEMRPAPQGREKLPTIISSFLVSMFNDIRNSHQLCWDVPHFRLWNFFIPALSFDINDLPIEFQYTEVLDYIKSLEKQTVMACVCGVSRNRPSGYPRYEWKGTNGLWNGDGILWRVHRSFRYGGNETCPCEDCATSFTPKRYWGEYIVLTTNTMLYDTSECLHSWFLLGYDSFEDIPNLLALKGVSVTCSDKDLNFSEVLCITHDFDTGKRVEDMCYRTGVKKKILLGRLHSLRMGKTLAVRISHPHGGPKHICVGEWLEFGAYRAPVRSGLFYTSAVCQDGGGGPVLFVDGNRAFISLHDTWNERRGVGRSSGKIWSL